MNDYSLPMKFDPIIHQPSRLSIIAVLAGAESVDFSYLLKTTELTKGTLSKHLSKLQEVGYIDIKKSYKDNYPYTTAKLTPIGRKAFKKYRRQYIAFLKNMENE